MTITTLDPSTWKWDFAKLPPEARLAFIGKYQTSNLIRLTAELYAFRAVSGSSPWMIGSLPDLIPHIEMLPIAQPYSPPTARQSQISDPLDFSNLTIALDI